MLSTGILLFLNLPLSYSKKNFIIISGVASYRHMKTVRTHLASLVLHNDDEATEETLPHDIHQGLTHILWNEFRKQGLVSHILSEKINQVCKIYNQNR